MIHPYFGEMVPSPLYRGSIGAVPCGRASPCCRDERRHGHHIISVGSSAHGIAASTQDALPAALFEAAAAGSALAKTIIDTICARLARGLAAVYLILDPDLVVIGGGLSRAGDQLLAAVERHLRPRTLVEPRLALSALGDTAVALGAVRRALNDVDDRVLTPLRPESGS
ncbi:ROK family protein [Nonomuraea sp. SMC257]|uniref:ROK family protein n=1 Tax=Nonomuraea montanisoli TaxID=2741721 RepID=A0A7Y6M5W8_9ACTN|nr:ROK family protein [Nonomuraea montanisoli]NUW36258.1 ROK family protein [Nonomuraea montanisoli]